MADLPTATLIGNPNCGKTTLFNVLTGSQYQTGNWSGVTVEQQKKPCIDSDLPINIVDLPGIYSLNSNAGPIALDEAIVRDYLLYTEHDLIINIMDASSVARHLYLTTQLIDRQVPMIIVLNMLDIAMANGISIDADQLSIHLGIPVIVLCSTQKQHVGFNLLKTAMMTFLSHKLAKPNPLSYSAVLENAILALQPAFQSMIALQSVSSRYLAVRALEEDTSVINHCDQSVCEQIDQATQQVEKTIQEETSAAFANERYRWICHLIEAVVSYSPKKSKTRTEWVDSIVLNEYLGIPIFLAVMYGLFSVVMTVGQIFQPAMEQLVQVICVNGVSHLLSFTTLPLSVTAVLISVGQGLSTVASFLPLIGVLFFCLAALESSGYMARAAFVVDKIMRKIDLPGQAFVPFIVGFGCNVPAIMATRTLSRERDRKLSILMNPFMSCSARLQVFSLLTSVFFIQGSQNVVFSLYVMGIAAALFTGFVMKKTLLTSEPALLSLELPAYHCPKLSILLNKTSYKIKYFVVRTGKTIVILVAAIQILNYFPWPLGDPNKPESILIVISKQLTPIFSPLGIESENWPATLGILTGTLAKETIAGVLNSAYQDMAEAEQTDQLPVEPYLFWEDIKSAFKIIPEQFEFRLMTQNTAEHPLSTEMSLSSPSKQMMKKLFTSQASVFSYLVFVLLYIPCVSTMGAIRREIGRKWMCFSIFWTTFLAYVFSVYIYQAATFFKHPATSFAWMVGLLISLIVCIMGLRYIASRMDDQEYRPIIIQ